MRLKSRIKSISKAKKIFALIVFAAIIAMIIYRPYGAEYAAEVDKEIVIAQKICESTRDFAFNNLSALKMDENLLRRVKVDGKEVKFKHIKHPRILFFHDGFVHPNSQVELFCHIKDPRTDFMRDTNEYFYDYRRQKWVSNTRTRG